MSYFTKKTIDIVAFIILTFVILRLEQLFTTVIKAVKSYTYYYTHNFDLNIYI